MEIPRITGLIAAAYTPMRPDGSIHLDPIREYSQYLSGNNLTGVFINGTTGEGIMLTTDERKRIAESWMKHPSDGFLKIIHVGGPSIETCKELALHAASIGADAISMIGPNFFKPPTVKELIAFVSEIASRVPDMPVYYYHIPTMSGVYLPMVEFLQQASGKITNLAGIKFTHYDLMEFNQCLMAENGKFDILLGHDEILLCGLVLGMHAAVGSTYNFMPRVYLRLMDFYNEGKIEEARQMQRISVNLIAILKRYGGAVACGKAIMNLLDMDFGPCRLPIKNLTSSDIDQLKSDLKGMDFFNQIVDQSAS